MPVPCSQEAQSRSSTTMLNIMFVSVSSPPQARALVAFVVSVGLPGCRSATSHVLVTLSSFLSNDREASMSVVHKRVIILFQFCSVPTTLLWSSLPSSPSSVTLSCFSSSNRVALMCDSNARHLTGGGTTASGGTEESCASKLRAFVFAVSV